MSRNGFFLVLVALAGLTAVIAYITLSGGDEPVPSSSSTGEGTPKKRRPEPAPLPPMRDSPPAAPRAPATEAGATAPALVTGRILGSDGEAVAEGGGLLTVGKVARPFAADETGRFLLPVDGPDAGLDLRARDHRPERREVRGLRAGEVRDIGEVRLDPGLAVSGRVLDTDGVAVAGIGVDALTEWELPEPVLVGTTTTDAQGEFRIGGLGGPGREEVGVRAAALGFRMEGDPKRVRPPAADVRLVVRRLRVATGLIVSEGEDTGIGGATVRLTIRLGDRGEARITQTLADGRFAFDLSEDRFANEELRYEVQAAAEGFDEASRTDIPLADLLPGAGFSLGLVRGVPAEPGRLRGRVLYDTGQAFTGALTLSFQRPGRAGQILRTETGEQGEYVVEGVLPGEYTLRSAPRDQKVLGRTSTTVVIPPGGEASADLVVPRGGDLDVRVESETGAAVKDAQVEVIGEDGVPVATYKAPEGGIRIYDLPAGRAMVRISARGYKAETAEVSVARDQATPVSVRLSEDR